jgi:hypothetical protein
MTVLQTLLISSLVAFGQVMNPPPDPANPTVGRGQIQPGGQRGRMNQPNPGPNVPIQELQEIFDAFALVQAQRILQLDDEQFGRFFPKMSRVYQLRRGHGQARMRLVNEIRRLFNGPQRGTDAALADAVARLDALEARFETDMRLLRQGVDEVLTPRQRAGLRFFEEDMERRKVDYMTQARQGGGGPGLPKLPLGPPEREPALQ